MKATFWRRLAGFHRAIRATALTTALQSGRAFRDFASAAESAPDAPFSETTKTTAHPIWASAFDGERMAVREMLEIGAFEGRTTAFAARLFPNARITAVDPWVEYNEMSKVRRAGEIFERAVAGYGARVRALKGFSNAVLPRLLEAGEQFDLVFVDGSHAYDDVVIDSDYAWALLKPGGILIWDDYLWRKAEYGRRVPKLAIDEFLTAKAGAFTPIFAFKQVAIRKAG